MPRDQHKKSIYIFGAICLERGVGVALVPPRCNTLTMQWHLDDISSQVTPGAHAVLSIDRHAKGELVIPLNITLLLLPPRSLHRPPVGETPVKFSRAWISSEEFCIITIVNIINSPCDFL